MPGAADTFPKLLLAKASELGDQKVALREIEFGIWQSVTWRQYLEHVKYFSLGLLSLGLKAGDKIAIIGDNRPEWVYAELAAQAAGAITLGLYQDSVAKELQYLIDFADVRFVVVEDQEQVDKILEVRGELPKLQEVIYYDPRGLRNYREPFLMHFPDVEKLGRASEKEHPDLFEQNVERGKRDDVAILCTTSGTTGLPKLAMLTHGNLISMGHNLMAIDPASPDDEFVSFLPLAWIGEQMMALSCGLTVGFTINFPEEPETVQEDIREIGPQVMFSPPRIWENMVSQVQVKIEDSTRLKKAMFRWAMHIGTQYADSRFDKREASSSLRLKYRLADWLVFQMVKDQLGLRHIRHAYTGGAALGPDVFRFFHAMGVNLKQIYGQTEISGISVVHRDGDIKFQTVGLPIPETQVHIDEETGEIRSRSPSVFIGYYNNPQATAETLIQGWLHSGDAGYLDADGHLIVIDRAKDVMTLHDGTKFSPQFIENKLKFSPYIKEAVVFGGDWPYVSAMINIDMANVGKWAENHQIAYTTYTDLAQKPEVYTLVAQDVTRTNTDLPAAARIKRFLLLHKELDADDAELTRTRKVRRRFVNERYQEIIDALYSDSDSLQIQSAITYQDGRTALIQTNLRIQRVEPVDQD
ncbi:MAG: AMP-binding protein [Anaerolineales bacterium]|nr:MAG: AMP-binding protein [Anaerolineales bacterium]